MCQHESRPWKSRTWPNPYTVHDTQGRNDTYVPIGVRQCMFGTTTQFRVEVCSPHSQVFINMSGYVCSCGLATVWVSDPTSSKVKLWNCLPGPWTTITSYSGIDKRRYRNNLYKWLVPTQGREPRQDGGVVEKKISPISRSVEDDPSEWSKWKNTQFPVELLVTQDHEREGVE